MAAVRRRQWARHGRLERFRRTLETGGGDREAGGFELFGWPVFVTAVPDVAVGLRHRHRVDPRSGVISGVDVSVAKLAEGAETVWLTRPDGTQVEIGAVRDWSVDRVVWSQMWCPEDSVAGGPVAVSRAHELADKLHARNPTKTPSDFIEWLVTPSALSAVRYEQRRLDALGVELDKHGRELWPGSVGQLAAMLVPDCEAAKDAPIADLGGRPTALVRDEQAKFHAVAGTYEGFVLFDSAVLPSPPLAVVKFPTPAVANGGDIAISHVKLTVD